MHHMVRHGVQTKHGDSETRYRQEGDDVQPIGETQGKGDVSCI